jgi:hypothetical protein
MLPFPHRDAPDAIASRQGAHTFRARGNLRAHRRRCPGVLMQTKFHLPLLSLSLANLPLPVIPHAQKTAASVKIGSNRPGCDTTDAFWSNLGNVGVRLGKIQAKTVSYWILSGETWGIFGFTGGVLAETEGFINPYPVRLLRNYGQKYHKFTYICNWGVASFLSVHLCSAIVVRSS